MQRKNIILSILIFIISQMIVGELIAENSIDSLASLLKKSNGYERVQLYSELSNKLFFREPKKTKEYGQEAYKYALSLKDDKSIALSTNLLAVSSYMLSEYDSADYYINISLKLYKELKDTLNIANNLRIIADIYSTRSENKTAQEYYIKSYELFEIVLKKNQDKKSSDFQYPILLNNFATFYSSLGDESNAMKYFRLALDFNKKIGNFRGQAVANFNIALIHLKKPDYDSTLFYLDKTIDFSRKTGNTNLIAKSYQIYVSYYFENGNHKKAFQMLDSAIVLYTELNDINGLADTYNQKSVMFYRENKFEDALKLQKECVQLAYKTDNKQLRLAGYQKVASLYEKLNDYKQANTYYHKWHNLGDSLNEINNKVLIAEMDNKFNFEKQERENSELRYQNELKQLNNNRLFIIVISLIVVLILASLVILLLRRKQNYEKQSNKLLSDKNSELELTNATKDKFFSIIAHDLRNPIGSFTKVVDLLQDEDAELSADERVSLLEMLNESSVNLSDLLENLLKWANSQRGLIKFNPTGILPYYIVESCINELRLTAKNKDITLSYTLPKELSISADANMLTTIFRNLISNAIKFTPIEGTISVGYINKIDKSIFFVKDSGVGMSQDTITKLFQVGENKSTQGTNNERGTGLGLILCKEFVLKHNGEIWVESIINEGSTFYFSILKEI